MTRNLTIPAMALCAGTLVASEFLPVALLPSIARDLGITEGQAGQVISVSGLFAVVSSLMIARPHGPQAGAGAVCAGQGRAGVIVTLAPNYPVLMAGLALWGLMRQLSALPASPALPLLILRSFAGGSGRLGRLDDAGNVGAGRGGRRSSGRDHGRGGFGRVGL